MKYEEMKEKVEKIQELKANCKNLGVSNFMREIKFRAFSLETKEMIPWEEAIFPEWLEDPDLVMMQFTGLKDKNGKEIYEGDIITNETEIVVSEYGVLDYTGEFQKTKCSVTYNSHFCMFNLTEDVHHGKFEVIGNIYKNPELLNK
jgi:hypothetical protein